MKPQAPLRIGETGLPATPGVTGPMGVAVGVGAIGSAASIKEVRGVSPVPGASSRRRRSTWLERFTHGRVVATVVGFSLVLWLVSGVMALKFLGLGNPVARDTTMAALAGGPAIPSEDLEALRQKAEQARSRLIPSRQKLKTELDRIEHEARQRGWQVELTLAPPIVGPEGIQELIAYPVVMQLAPSRSDAIPGFGSLIEWLEGVFAESRSTKVTGIALKADGKRLGMVRVEIQVMGGVGNDQASPK